MLKHRLSLKTIIPNFVASFVSLGIIISCIRKMPFSVTSAKGEFTPAIVSLSTSQEVDNVPLVRDSEPIRLLEIPTSPSLYMLITNTYTSNIVYIVCSCSCNSNFADLTNS